MYNFALYIDGTVFFWINIYFDLFYQGSTYLLVSRMVFTRDTIKHLNFLVLRVIFFLNFFQNNTLINVFILIDGWKDVSCINHDPPKPFIGLLSFSYLSDGSSYFRSDTLLFFDDVLFSKLEFKRHFTRIGLNWDCSFKIWKTLKYSRNSERTRELFFFIGLIQNIIFVDDLCSNIRDKVIFLL